MLIFPNIIGCFALLLWSQERVHGNGNTSNVSPLEMQALNDFYVSTYSDDWMCGNDEIYDWDFSPTANPCVDNWVGISCILPSPYNVYYVSELKLDYCNMRGSLPDSIGDFANLTILMLTGNQLTGTLPETVGNLVNLIDIELDYNLMEGSLPSSLSRLTSLLNFVITSNRFEGPIPWGVLWNEEIGFVSANSNFLSGQLPDAPTDWSGKSKLRYLDVSENHLSGTLPITMPRLDALLHLLFEYNYLSGPVNENLPKYASTLWLNNNQFSGELSPALFNGSEVTELLLQYNCFHGTIPHEVCALGSIQILHLGCLSCANACVTRLFADSAFITHHRVSGSIPTCLYEMPTLLDLHLNDNDLSGSIPYTQTFARQLERVDAYNNMLTGELPQRLGLLPDNYFDLHSNKFSGSVHLNVSQDQPYWIFDATYNRLSGAINGDILTLATADYSVVDLLAGNIFSCSAGRSDLPASDADVDKYQCGSDSYNRPYLLWTVTVAFLAATVTALLYVTKQQVGTPSSLSETIALLQGWVAISLGSKPSPLQVEIPSLSHIWEVTTILCKTGGCCAALATFVLAPVYCVLSAYFGTYSHQYAWIVSSVLISGRVPFALQFLLFLATLGILVYVFKTSPLGVSRIEAGAVVGEDKVADRSRKLYVVAVCSVYVLVNLGVVGTVNFAFVSSSIYADPVIQVYISAFKIFWNILCAPYLSCWLVYQLAASRVDFFTLELVVSLVNNVGLPLLAVFLISPQCFYNLFCSAINSYGTVSCNYPFHYYYECSYVYMNYYAAAFIYVRIFTTFGTPLVELVPQQIHARVPPGSIWYKMLDGLLPRILRPIPSDPDQVPARSAFRPYFDSTQFLVNQLTFLALILTLGVVSPPLAVALAVAMVVTAVFAVLKVGRFLSNAVDAKQMKYVELIDAESRGVAAPDMLQRSAWVLVYFSCSFMTLFLFDTLGDAVGFEHAYWVLIFVPLLPLLAYGIMVTARAVLIRSGRSGCDGSVGEEVEREVSNIILDHTDMGSNSI